MAGLAEGIERCVDPGAVAATLERMESHRPGTVARLESEPGTAAATVAVVGASRSLGRLLETDDGALDVLADLEHRRALDPGADARGLAGWKAREVLRIAARDLTGLDSLEVVGRALADMADEVMAGALRVTGTPPAGLAVIAMGKLGARELNYASDVDVVFVGEADVRPVLEVARTCFRVDANLRPEGRDGPLVRSLESYVAYWDRWARPWEFQALMKARPAAGDPASGEAFAAAAAVRVWERPFGADDLRSLRAMKARSEDHTARRGLTERELKLGRGGIRDIEFAAQLLQLVHGRHDPALRAPATLAALEELSSAGYVDPRDGAALASAYRFLRAAEHRLQLRDEQQVHAVPSDPSARSHLARTLGFRDDAGGSALGRFDARLSAHRSAARAIHERLYFRPLLEAFVGTSQGTMTEAMAEERLAAFGFADADRTRVALRELTRGLTRTSRLMSQLLPLLLHWLSESPDPDLGLLGLRTLATGPHRATRLVESFRESPEAARQLCRLLGTSRVVQRGFEQHPDAIRALASGRMVEVPSRDRLRERMRSASALPHGQRSLRRAKEAEELRVATRDILGLSGVEDTASELTALNEAVLAAVLDAAGAGPALSVVAMGRFGGSELSYASDLDLLFVHDGRTPGEAAAAEARAEAVLRLMHGTSPATRLGTVDAGLRPEGRHGPLSRSLDGYAGYYRRWAATWERQALVRARPAGGDPELGRRFLELVHPFVWAPLTEAEAREIRRMKARIERERIPPGEDPDHHLKLGRGSLSDVEWAVQLLQLRHRVPEPGTMAALDRLEGAGLVEGTDAAVLRDAYRFCERARNRLFLVRGGPGESLPTDPAHLGRLARSLDLPVPELREQYRRVTRRARAVFERVFFGAGA